MRFVSKEIFPGGEVPSSDDVVEFSREAGFSVEHIDLLTPHYARTLNTWAADLQARRSEAIAATSEEVYERYMRYLTGCADFFQRGISEVGQFTLTTA
jgi:cyclopropane-fatty-acyl-phospholipid synthase